MTPKNTHWLFVVAVLLVGCGPGEHAPKVGCINFGIENVRRNIKLRVSVSVGRPPLNGVSSETVKLRRLPSGTEVPGNVYYSANRILFIPHQPLLDSTEYRFEITEGITDVSNKELSPMYQDFWTGKVLQVCYIDLLRDYDAWSHEVHSIAIFFSEGVHEATLRYISLTDALGHPISYDITYYEDIALCVLLFYLPLTTGTYYYLTLADNILSDADMGRLDGDRDGFESDGEPFMLQFSYATDDIYGIIVADSITNAAPYYEPYERCFLYEYE